MSIVLAATLCNPLKQTRRSQNKWQGPLTRIGEKVRVGGGGVWFQKSWEGQDMAQNTDRGRQYVKGIDFLGVTEVLIPMPWTQHIINMASLTAGTIVRSRATTFRVLPLPALRGQSPAEASLPLGSWPRSHFTHLREADTSGLGCVVQHNSWTAAAVPPPPFQKKNKNESGRGIRQALRALTEGQEAVLKQRLRGTCFRGRQARAFAHVCAPLSQLSSPLLTPFP